MMAIISRECFRNMTNILQNDVISHMWFNISASNGDEDASKMKDVVAKYMTSEQLAKAQELARECIKKNYKDCG